MKLPIGHYKVEALMPVDRMSEYRALCAANPHMKVDPEQLALPPRHDRLALLQLLVSPLGGESPDAPQA